MGDDNDNVPYHMQDEGGSDPDEGEPVPVPADAAKALDANEVPSGFKRIDLGSISTLPGISM